MQMACSSYPLYISPLLISDATTMFLKLLNLSEVCVAVLYKYEVGLYTLLILSMYTKLLIIYNNSPDYSLGIFIPKL